MTFRPLLEKTMSTLKHPITNPTLIAIILQYLTDLYEDTDDFPVELDGLKLADIRRLELDSIQKGVKPTFSLVIDGEKLAKLESDADIFYGYQSPDDETDELGLLQ